MSGKPRWVKNQWNGLDNYQCSLCPFATLDHDLMKEHARDRHPLESESAPDVAATTPKSEK